MANIKNNAPAPAEAETNVPAPAGLPDEFAGLTGSALLMAMWNELNSLKARVGDGKSDKEKSAAAKAERDAKRKAAEAELEEYVEVMITKIPVPGYKEPVFLAINGENCRIERGVRVKIKRKFANLLDQSQLQDANTIALMEKEERKFATDPNTLA